MAQWETAGAAAPCGAGDGRSRRGGTGDLSPPAPCSFVTCCVRPCWGRMPFGDSWGAGTGDPKPGLEGAAIVPPAELAAGEVTWPP